MHRRVFTACDCIVHVSAILPVRVSSTANRVIFEGPRPINCGTCNGRGSNISTVTRRRIVNSNLTFFSHQALDQSFFNRSVETPYLLSVYIAQNKEKEDLMIGKVIKYQIAEN